MRLSGTVFSKVLGMDTGLTVVTPNALKEGQEYKVAYLLHGLCGSHATWLDYSMLPVYAAAGNTVYILPEGGRSFYSDMKYGLRYFTYLIDELPSLCQSIFRISAKRENTIVMGGSMGGYGALKCALTRPERYGMCGAFSSGALFLKEGLAQTKKTGMDPKIKERFGEELMRDFTAIFGEDMEWNPEADILELAKKIGQGVPMPRLYITCGTKDPFYQEHLSFCKELDHLSLPYEFEEWEAEHDFEYFNQALKKTIDKFSL